MLLKLIKTTQICLIFRNLLGFLINEVIQNLSFTHFVSLKFFETTQRFLLFPNLIGSSYK